MNGRSGMSVADPPDASSLLPAVEEDSESSSTGRGRRAGSNKPVSTRSRRVPRPWGDSARRIGRLLADQSDALDVQKEESFDSTITTPRQSSQRLEREALDTTVEQCASMALTAQRVFSPPRNAAEETFEFDAASAGSLSRNVGLEREVLNTSFLQTAVAEALREEVGVISARVHEVSEALQEQLHDIQTVFASALSEIKCDCQQQLQSQVARLSAELAHLQARVTCVEGEAEHRRGEPDRGTWGSYDGLAAGASVQSVATGPSSPAVSLERQSTPAVASTLHASVGQNMESRRAAGAALIAALQGHNSPGLPPQKPSHGIVPEPCVLPPTTTIPQAPAAPPMLGVPHVGAPCERGHVAAMMPEAAANTYTRSWPISPGGECALPCGSTRGVMVVQQGSSLDHGCIARRAKLEDQAMCGDSQVGGALDIIRQAQQQLLCNMSAAGVQIPAAAARTAGGVQCGGAQQQQTLDGLASMVAMMGRPVPAATSSAPRCGDVQAQAL